jgi:polyhydroxyalkanoate synthesis regulator phasin
MEETLKNFLYAGVGLTTEATEKFKKSFDELVQKGKVSDTEAKKFVDEFVAKTTSTKSEFDTKFNDFLGKWGFTRTEEVTSLKKRVEELEAKLAEKATKTTKATA